ncbi:hypothetical protein PPL_07397 [Heterostelium album PN500]|uniref:SHOCT domain-containing protein n=1 Tax=Heterostelium pallidum (strain ATCC 26659 / Pp 5 / PN500) TaxID=670386 RepID=D3BFU6_HETP5|nr:hypothetical protein PPL_07397 [Heterostelium album PN500]EFA79706.1 hypothetical protein PPL_07397 [Heterostelium album PN500]|eukprot:XP_020431827.1 hypothetical protein PPL_07397 [Heterostelium album PN500]
MDIDLIEKYNKIKDIFESGFITEHEFTNRKKELLGDQLESFEKNYKNVSGNNSDENNIPVFDYSSNAGGNSDSFNNNNYSYNENNYNSYNDSSNYNNQYNNYSTATSYDYNSTNSNNDYNSNNYDSSNNYNSSYDYNSVTPVKYTSNNLFGDDETEVVYPIKVEKKVNNLFDDDDDESPAIVEKSQPAKYAKSAFSLFDNDSDEESLPAPIPVTPAPPVPKISRVIQDRLTEKSKAKVEITYPHQVKGSYKMYKEPIDGVIAYYRTKEFLYQSKLTSLDNLSQLDMEISSKFFSKYSLQEIVLQHHEPGDNNWLTDSNSCKYVFGGKIYNIFDKNIKPGHYKIVPDSFLMYRRNGPKIFGEFEYGYSKDFPMPPQHFITHRPFSHDTYLGLSQPNFVLKSIANYDNLNQFNKKLLFINHLRMLQFKGCNMFNADRINLPTESVKLSQLIKNCIDKKECFFCKSSTYSEFLCYQHFDDKLLEKYYAVQKEMVPSNSDEVDAEIKSDDVRDYSKEPKFCYALPEDLFGSKAFRMNNKYL